MTLALDCKFIVDVWMTDWEIDGYEDMSRDPIQIRKCLQITFRASRQAHTQLRMYILGKLYSFFQTKQHILCASKFLRKHLRTLLVAKNFYQKAHIQIHCFGKRMFWHNHLNMFIRIQILLLDLRITKPFCIF